MPADERASAQHRFMEGDAEIVVATNAFGMGVDKADVRAVIHWAIPKSVEAYYQEVGRGGRDGDPARAILLASRADLGRLINFIKGDAVQADDVLGYVRRLRGASDGDAAVIEAPRSDRDRISLGVAERAAAVPARAGAGRAAARDFRAPRLAPATSPRSAARRRIAPGARTAPSRRSARRRASAGGGRCSRISATGASRLRPDAAATSAIRTRSDCPTQRR